jgi:hypothetical protein
MDAVVYVVERQPLEYSGGYLESDNDFIRNNQDIAVELLENGNSPEYPYSRASLILINKVESIARRVVLEEKSLRWFVMGMGVWFFVDARGSHHDSRKTIPAIGELEDLMAEWDAYIKLSGEPMRINKRGKKFTD